MRGLLVSTCLLLACAHGPRPPSLDGWRELRSAHFILRTDLPEDSARVTLEKLETLRWWLQAAWSTGGDSPGTTNAIVLDDPAELRTFVQSPGIATTARDGPLLVTAGTDAAFGDRSPGVQILAHEIAHELIRRRMPGAPRWFHEGLAGHLESVTPIDDHRVRFGGTGPDGARPAASHTWPATTHTDEPIPEPPLLSLDETASRHWETATAEKVNELYRAARLWVELLRLDQPVLMRSFETALASGTSWQRAWADLRRQLDLPALEEKMWWAQRQGLAAEVRTFPPFPPSATAPQAARPLARWEVHLCQAELWAMAARMPGGEGLGPRVKSELEAAAAAAPDEALPRIRLADLERDPDVRREEAEFLVERFPRSPDARVFLARVLRDDGGPVEGRQAVALAAVIAAPDSVDALTAHAIEEVRAGNAAASLKSVARAEELEPWNPSVFVARAVVLSALGRCDEAVDAVQRALDVLPDNPPPGDVQELIGERARIAAACRSRTGP